MKAITTKYLPYTATKPSRITAFDSDGHRVTMSTSVIPEPSDADANRESQHAFVAEALKTKMKWDGRLIGGSVKGGYVFVFTDKESA